MDRLYVVTRRDLAAPAQAVQSCHAALQFVAEHEAYRRLCASIPLVLLTAHDEAALQELAWAAEDRGVLYSTFREPDLENQATALALEPGVASRRLCNSWSRLRTPSTRLVLLGASLPKPAPV